MSAAEHLQEAIDVGCTRDDHDHVGDHRAEVLAEAYDAITARAVELSATAEEELRRDLEETAQEWHSAALVVAKLMTGSPRKDTGDATQAPAGESTQVWHVFDEDTAHATPRLYASVEAARLGTIARYEEMEGVCPDYSWRPDDDVWELLAGGDPVGIYFAPVSVNAEAESFVPRTERSYWVAIADALNAATTAGMPVGIDLDGTLTDHNAWSVIWNREAERWEVGGYDVDADGVYADVPDAEPDPVQSSTAKLRALLAGGQAAAPVAPPRFTDTSSDEWVRCSSSHCPNCERYDKATGRGWVNGHMDSWHCPDHSAQAEAPTYADTRGEPGGDH